MSCALPFPVVLRIPLYRGGIEEIKMKIDPAETPTILTLCQAIVNKYGKMYDLKVRNRIPRPAIE